MKKFVICALMLLTTMVFAQYITPTAMIDGATGNIVYTTVNPPPPGADPFSWVGFITTGSNGGGLQGGNVPGYNPNTGTFMFGYMQGTVAYSTPVNYALSMAGTNIQVNGFKYSWEYYNQDMSRGTLSGNINLTNKNGQVVENYNYNMPQTTNGWTLMSGTENFKTQYAASTVGNLNVSFTGKDDRWWAGYYGPQIRAIDVNLLYSVAPAPVPTDFLKWVPLTSENGEFTLTKPGVVRYGAYDTYVYQSFQAGTYSCSNSAWGVDPIGGVYKSCSLGSNTSPTPTPTVPKTTSTTDTYATGVTLIDPTTPTTTPTASATTSTVVDTSSTPVTTTSSPSTQQSVVSSVVSAPAPATSTSTSTSSSSTTASSSQSTKESSGSGGSTSLALSIISKNSERDAAGTAVAQSAISQANQAAAQAQQEAANIASSAVSNSMSANAVSSGGPQLSGTGIRAMSNNSGMAANTNSAMSINMTGSSQQIFVSPQTNTTLSTTSAIQGSVATQSTTPTTSQTNTTSQTTETYPLLTPNMLTDRTNPLTDIVEGKQLIPQSNTAVTTGPVVNKNAQDSDVAGGVSINKMATAPAGYGDYLNFVMRDVAFYAPKEVYKNQRNVDNARALRLLTNDSKHKEMVEMQYAR